jgi:hypothetical protein
MALRVQAASPSNPTNYNKEQIILLNILPDCSLTSISATAISDLTYDISSGVPSVFDLPTFTTGFTYCDSQLVFSLTDASSSIPPDPVTFSLLPESKLSVSTSDKTMVRAYSLVLSVSLSTLSSSSSFQMLITDLCQTALPVPITNEPQKYVIGDQAPLKFDLAPWIDSRGANKCGTIEYKV